MPVPASSIGPAIGANFDTDEARHEAVRGRDPTADGHFVYSVASTGIYCRPSCRSRPARRENVAFHADAADAEAAGFRACRRCTPNGPSPAQARVAAIASACRLIDNAEEPPGLDELATAAAMSRFHFHRVFKAVTGVTPKAYASAGRARRVRDALGRETTVTRAIYASGYNATSRFYENAERDLGMRPRDYRDGGHGAAVRFAVGRCSLGSVLVASTAKGVCAITLGDDPERLIGDLRRQFPKADVTGADAGFQVTVAQVIGLIDGPDRTLGLPLDIRGTAFQCQVWEALGRIPAGSTLSYGELAAAVGRPRSVRAVARACASNRIAVAIPCHRVVRADGEPSGYRWGIERKRALLAREGR